MEIVSVHTVAWVDLPEHLDNDQSLNYLREHADSYMGNCLFYRDVTGLITQLWSKTSVAEQWLRERAQEANDLFLDCLVVDLII
jgi:hypothetical protein